MDTSNGIGDWEDKEDREQLPTQDMKRLYERLTPLLTECFTEYLVIGVGGKAEKDYTFFITGMDSQRAALYCIGLLTKLCSKEGLQMDTLQMPVKSIVQNKVYPFLDKLANSYMCIGHIYNGGTVWSIKADKEDLSDMLYYLIDNHLEKLDMDSTSTTANN
jgi:hypothetical protein